MDQDDFDFDDDFMEDPPDEPCEDIFDEDSSVEEFLDPEDEIVQPDSEISETKPDGFDFGNAFVIGSMIGGNIYEDAQDRRTAEKQRRRKKKNG